MTPEQLEMVQTTAARLESERGRFADLFYDHLFAIAPHVRELFPEDMTAQKSKLVDELEFLAAAARDLDVFVARATELGARHHDYGVHAADYANVESALVYAITEILGELGTDEVIDAWQRLYELISQTMIDGASSELYSTT
jgi:hemoglobin-like flavoprotein